MCDIFFQAYYRQGVALQCLGRHAEGLAAFSNGLAQDPKSVQLLAGLIEAAMKSPLKGKTSLTLINNISQPPHTIHLTG